MKRPCCTLLLVLAAATHSVGQDCTGWVERLPPQHPEEPDFPVMAFDESRGRIVVFEPIGEPNMRNTWEWDGSDWMLRSTGGPPVRFRSTMVYDSVRKVCVLFGGNRTDAYFDETWEWDGTEWSQRSVEKSPPARSGHAMSFDSKRGVAVIYGGVDLGLDLDDTWEYDGESWALRAEDGPDQASREAMAFDAVAGNTVLFGDAYTWTWDGSTWTLLDVEPPQPIGRHRHSMAYDGDKGVVVLFGGTNGGSPLDDTWEWNGTKWSERASIDKPLARFEAGMAYDSVRHVMVLLGGNRGGNPLTDTWEFVCEPPCYADLDGSGILDLFDLFAFVNLFNTSDPKADCDASGVLDLFDFLCFLNEFNAGCP